MERRKLKLDYAACLLLLFSSMLSAGEVDITRVENKMSELRRTLGAMPDAEARQGVYYRLRKDPFIPLVSEKKTVEVTEGKKEKVIPVVSVSGIVFDKRMPLAIIGAEVKKEGEAVGEYQVYKIEKDRVLIKFGEEIFPFEVKK